MSLKKALVSITIAISICFSAAASAADVVIGVANWPSVRVTADILKVIIEENYGLEVELQNGTNPIIFEAMDQNQMHVHPEVWLPNQQNLHDTYIMEKKSVAMNPHGVPSFTGMCVSKATAERTGIQRLEELADPDMAQNFDTDGDGKGNIWIGAAGWASTNIEMIRAKSYGFDETMNLDIMDETLAIAQVDAAVKKDENIVFMCYTPHSMFTLFDLVVLEEPEHDPDQWVIYQPTDDPDWLEKSSAPIAWSTPLVHITYAVALKNDQPEVAKLLSSITFTVDDLSDMTYAILVDEQDPAMYAKEWVNGNSDRVDSWIQ